MLAPQILNDLTHQEQCLKEYVEDKDTGAREECGEGCQEELGQGAGERLEMAGQRDWDWRPGRSLGSCGLVGE